MNADSNVMEHFPAPLSNEQSQQLANKLMQLIAERGWGLWAVEHKESGKLMGFTGLHLSDVALPIRPSFKHPGIEINWRFLSDYWGSGYANEAANAVLTFAFEELNVSQIISYTALSNLKSQRLMERIGLSKQQHFNHPALANNHPLAEHVLYTISQAEFKKQSCK